MAIIPLQPSQIDFAVHQKHFTSHRDYCSLCENSCMMSCWLWRNFVKSESVFSPGSDGLMNQFCIVGIAGFSFFGDFTYSILQIKSKYILGGGGSLPSLSFLSVDCDIGGVGMELGLKVLFTTVKGKQAQKLS